MVSEVYTKMAAEWDNVVGLGVTNMVAHTIAAGAEVMTTMGGLWVIIFGAAMVTGQISFAVGTRRILQMVSVATLLTATYFAQFIQEPLMDTIPQWIANSTGGTNVQGLPQQFDQIRDLVSDHQAAILQQATGLFSLGIRLQCNLMALLIDIELTIVFIIYEISRGMMSLLIVAAPLMIWLYIFDATRHIVMNLAGAAISLLLLQLLMSVIVAMNVAADLEYIRALPALAGDMGNDGMAQIFTFALFGTIMACLSPELAAKIGNGVVPNITPMLKSAMKAVTAL